MHTLRSTLIFLLIATLPLFSLRGATGGLSITLLLLITIVLVVPWRVPTIGAFEFAHIAYLMAAAISAVAFVEPGSMEALGKSVAYFVAFLALREVLREFSEEDVRRIVLIGAQIGTIAYISLASIAVLRSGVANSILSDLSYYGFGFRVQVALNDLFGGRQDIASADTMRNTIGEVFALLCVLPIVLRRGHPTRMDVAFALLAGLCVLSTFSRRAMIDVSIIVLALGFVAGMSRTAWVGIMSAIIASAAIAFGFFGVDNRLADLSGGSRIAQYQEAIYWIAESPLTGVGYGAKLAGTVGEETSVHNFVLQQGFMLGVGGLFFSFFVIGTILKYFVESIRDGDRIGLLLIIPLVGMTISSTTDGIYGPVAWIVFALCISGRSGKKRFARREFYRYSRNRTLDSHSS